MKRSWTWMLAALPRAAAIGLGLFCRKLVRGSEYDVQFGDAEKEYAFGVAIFDNAQVRHAYTPGVLKLGFE
jgi:hypothetical protein